MMSTYEKSPYLQHNYKFQKIEISNLYDTSC
jgi:hypothetical protein